jgi:mRNA-degrading endonuclease RelE of RelBE toxin-antitoxin system
MLIVETPVFTRRVLKLLSDDNYRFLQQILVADPEAGDLIRHSGGLRKIRWSVAGRGKRGGGRAIYYWAPARETILMLLMYERMSKTISAPNSCVS